MKNIFLLSIFLGFFSFISAQSVMMYGDSTRIGRPFSKDPYVINFKGCYFIYYSIPPIDETGWAIGIAKSNDLINWNKVGEILPEKEYEKKGLCAPGLLVENDTINIFYQTYGNGKTDAICHATSVDGINFKRNETNPIFNPSGDWTCGRAIDAEVIKFKNNYFLYFATRDKDFIIQKQGVAVAPKNSNFNRNDWKQVGDSAILEPEFDWEGKCIEAASVIQKGNTLYMFYAGNYNNAPQQIGVAQSKDGIHWKRVFDTPFLKNGEKGSWNSSESGHPQIFKDKNGKTYLFYQGNNDNGKTWFITNQEVGWKKGKPYLKN
ncbi:MAG: family 43 glycosylhydrolase [Bacteroidales bacterium]|nr:family 43 glycosylhydrolase [Bacteroidales bacterium]